MSTWHDLVAHRYHCAIIDADVGMAWCAATCPLESSSTGRAVGAAQREESGAAAAGQQM